MKKRLIWASVAFVATGLIIYFVLGIIPIPSSCATLCYSIRIATSILFGIIGAFVTYYFFFD